MAFTYDLSTDRGKLRFKIGDTVEDDGILPGGTNFSDAEIDHALDLESDDQWGAAALLFSVAASKFASQPIEYRLGPETEKVDAYTYFMNKAQEALDKVSAGGVASISLEKADYGIDRT